MFIKPPDSPVDPDNDVLVTKTNVILIATANGPAQREDGQDQWNVFHGDELVDVFGDRDSAVGRALAIAKEVGRPAWISINGITFEPLAPV
ncbi:MAG: hypothetical protein Q8O42_15580 [Acidobacteriota bacterium]|nr:hypothetical protein [Acidobacteriota bacterium]